MFPLFYDLFLAPYEWLGLRRLRAEVAAPAAGRVLEIGAGTGLNLPAYRDAAQLVVTDPDAAMLRRAQRRASGPVHVVAADAERLPFAAATFDTVVATLAFCTIPHPERALEEVRRVLVPGGTLRMLEHVRTERSWMARVQDFLTPAWRRVARGCHLNRRTLETACAHGFVPRQVRYRLDGWLLTVELQTAGATDSQRPISTPRVVT